jgi:hypothetical protein
VIVDALLSLFRGLIDLILPVGDALGLTIPTGVLRGYTWLDSMAPLHEIVTGAGIILVATVAVFLIRLALTVWAAIPGKFS